MQKPLAGEKLAKGAAVRLDVSLQPPVVVPNVQGMRVSTARTTLNADHLIASVRYVPSRRPANTVVAQLPSPGQKVKRGTRVQVNVAKRSGSGPSGSSASAVVPDVVGEDESTATADLEAAGFTVTSVDSQTNDPGQDGLVIDQDPNGGASASDSSDVTIYVGRYSGG